MVSSIIGIPLYIFSYQYRSLSGYFTSELIYKFLARNFLLITLIYIVGKIFYLNFPDFRFWLVFFLINNFILIGIRLIIKDLIQFINHADNKYQPKVIIYGAGAAGAQLSGSINLSRNYQIEAFIDDNPSLWGRSLNSKKIISYNKIFEIKSKIKYIFLAIPSLDKIRKKEILNSLSKYKIPILEIPSIKELTSGKAQINSLRPIDLEDLLGRRAIYTNSKLVGNKIKNSVILVTGAGGSIGSELSKQIIAFNPKKLILLESNEFALYNLITELNELDLNKTEIVPVLGDAKNEILLNEIFDNNHIKVVFHAAAYKHVPLVEINALEGLLNNILSSYLICKISSEKSPTDIVLISSDKAVRPTNIMGASKRLSELIFKSFSKISCKNFSMVRFGNVIGSSGSVVPLFKKQIENGGPIKVTHKKIIRYFMTINEACGLVLQTIELSKGGDIFLLDMGEPKKIIDLAKQMILLSGLQVKDEQNPDGDIEIITTGLRPGEKLFEELLVDGKSEITSHPLIFRANEDSDLNDEFISNVNFLIELLEKRDKTNSLSLLSELIPDWVNNNT
ncbi:MAG: polysaccharide biosynthesis protein [Prochlorococcus marinus XMU1428]|nr:polysaccharide biosynthesis protein [Prochlorococcus marinus XMU1428]